MSNPTAQTTTSSLSLPNGTNPATELQFRLDNYFSATQPPSARLTAAAAAGDDPNPAETEERLQRLNESVEGLVGVIKGGAQ